MAISITDRPSKTLSNGFLSKWSSSELPLQYKLASNLFPINTSLPSVTISSLSYVNDKKGTRIIVSDITGADIGLNRTVKLESTGTSLDGGTYSVKGVVSNTELILDVRTNETSTTGTAQRTVTNYKGLLKVFAGSPDQHPYNLDNSKPLEEIGIIEVDFKEINGVNVGIADVRGYIKAAINAKFDTDENTHFGWSSYSVQYAETLSYVSQSGEIVTFTSDFVDDLQSNCSEFTGFDDPSFDNGLTDWSEANIPLRNDTSWVGGVGSVSVSVSQSLSSRPFASEILYQTKNIYSGVSYSLQLDLTYSGSSSSCAVFVSTSGGSYLSSLRVDSSGVYTIYFTSSSDLNDIGIAIGNVKLGDTSDIVLNSLEINTTAVLPCLFTQWANFGAKQFQDDLGGNFGDYVLNPVDTLTPKMLTHFDSKTFFKGKPFYFSAIIPASTFSLSEDSNNVNLDVKVYKNGSLVSSFYHPVNNSGEGVYTLDVEPDLVGLDWDSGTAQFTIIPTNNFTDGDFGTFEDDTPGNWNISSLSSAAAGVSGNVIAYEGNYSCQFDLNYASFLDEGETELYIFDSPIRTNIGLDYAFNSHYYIDNNYSPNLRGKAYIYFKIEGTDITTNKIFLDYSSPFTPKWESLSTTFTATTETVRYILCIETTQFIIGGGGAGILIDSITNKGPIDYISEVKPITNSKECDRYGGTLRWLNDLNGWESWNFTKKKIVKEKVGKKIDIVNDYSNDWDNSFINSETQRDTIQTTANKSIVLRSQLLNTNQKTILEQIKRSARVQYLTDSGKWQTVTIKASGYEIIDEEQKIHDMQIEINLPDLIIQAQ